MGGTERHLPYKLKAQAGAVTVRGGVGPQGGAAAEAGTVQGHQALKESPQPGPVASTRSFLSSLEEQTQTRESRCSGVLENE